MLLLQELFTAIETGNVEEVELILKTSRRQDPRHFDLNQRLRPMYEMTPLHLAVGLNSKPIVKFLLTYGADPNSLNCSESVSPLHLSILYELDGMVKLLVEYGGDPKLLDGEKKSCFDLAIENDVAHLLEQLNLTHGHGQTNRSRRNVNVISESEVETETETEDDADAEAEYLRKTAVDPVSPTFIESASMLTTQQPPGGMNKNETPKIVSPQTEVDSFYSCLSAAMKTARSENTLQSAESIGKRKCVAKYFPQAKEELQSSASTSPTSSHDVWEPGYSYMFTDDDGTCYGTDEAATDADKSSSPDTTIVVHEEFEVPTQDEGTETESESSPISLVSESSVASIRNSASPPTPIQSSTPKKKNLKREQGQDQDTKAMDNALRISSISSIAAEGPDAVPTVYATPKATATPTATFFPRILKERLAENENEQKNLVPIPSPAPVNSTGCGFSLELQTALLNLDLIQIWGNLKIELIQSLTPTKRRVKSFYNYVLLDPKIIRRANFSGNHLKHDIIKNPEKFERFLSAVFYVGKGCGNRPIAHLEDAKIKLMQMKRTTGTTMGMSSNNKLSKILQIWKAGQGVMLHSVFHHSEEREANIYEAAMIDALGINSNTELTNLKKGSYLGTGAMQWTQKTKNQFGSFLLYKCFCSFVVSDGKVFFPHDV